jgi:hypothetical protein
MRERSKINLCSDSEIWFGLVTKKCVYCRFITPDGYTLHVENGNPTVNDKPVGDTVRPDSWKYQWFGLNDSSR